MGHSELHLSWLSSQYKVHAGRQPTFPYEKLTQFCSGVVGRSWSIFKAPDSLTCIMKSYFSLVVASLLARHVFAGDDEWLSPVYKQIFEKPLPFPPEKSPKAYVLSGEVSFLC